jgi:hypothetical protein
MEGVIEQVARESGSALLVLPDLFTATNRQSIIALAAHHRLPAVYPFRYFVASGGLMSYGIEMLETYRQAASYVDRILKGERPSDLPVQQPTKFEFVACQTSDRPVGTRGVEGPPSKRRPDTACVVDKFPNIDPSPPLDGAPRPTIGRIDLKRSFGRIAVSRHD